MSTKMMLCAALLSTAVAAQPQVVLPGLGRLQGVVKTTPSQVDVDHFLGVRYTRAPVGDLRFRAPTDPLPWEGTYDATQTGNTCPGSNCAHVGGTDSEDCLYLNVFTPVGAASLPPQSRLPVMVFLHGGAFVFGCSNEFPAENWVAASVQGGHPVIAVTLNYRLNFFGFLGSNELRGNDTSLSTGNFGILDQRKALEWVRRNIARFGGNPHKVTLAGQSAGASSINVHLAAQAKQPRREWLFHRASAHTGLASSTFGFVPLARAEQVYTQIKGLLGCEDVECMRAAPVEQYLAHLMSFPLIGSFSPAIDGVVLEDALWKLLRDGKFANLPVLTGATRDEYSYLIFAGLAPLPDAATEAHFDVFLSTVLPAGTEGVQKLAELKQLYSNESYTYPPVSEWGDRSYWWWAAMRALSDQFFNCPNQYGARALARGPAKRCKSRAPVYQYLASRVLKTQGMVPGTGPQGFAVPHSSELMFYLNCSLVGDCLAPLPQDICPKKVPHPHCAFDSDAEQNLGSRMSSLLTRWAAGQSLGRPFLRTSGFRSLDYSVGLDVAEEDGGRGFFPIMNSRKEQCEFWDGIDRPDSDVADE